MNLDEQKALLVDLQAEAERLATVINAPKNLRLQKYKPDDDGFWLTTYYVQPYYEDENDDGNYIALMCKENGVEWNTYEVPLKYAKHADSILFRFSEGLVHTMAHRKYNEISGANRRMLFAIRESLMEKLNVEWAKKMKERHSYILKTDPIKNESL